MSNSGFPSLGMSFFNNLSPETQQTLIEISKRGYKMFLFKEVCDEIVEKSVFTREDIADAVRWSIYFVLDALSDADLRHELLRRINERKTNTTNQK